MINFSTGRQLLPRLTRNVMSKRNLASPSTPSRKKSKGSSDQHSLHRYFDASAKRESTASPSKSKAKQKTHTIPTAAGVQLQNDHIDITADDALYAWKLAEKDGLDLDTLRKLENANSRGAQVPRPATVEVIDVDLEDEITPAAATSTTEIAGPSTPTLRPATRSIPGSPSVPPQAVQTYSALHVHPAHYDLESGTWPTGSPAPYSFLAHTLATVSGTRSRITILNTLTNALRTITMHHPPSLLPALYLLSNSLSPPYSPIELGLGPSIISKAIQNVSGLTSAALKRLYTSTGDAGDVAFEAKSNVRTLIPHPPLLIIGVYGSLLKIAHAKGQGATKQKQSTVEQLLVAAKGEEIRFLVRILSQNLRVGAVRTSILTALARAMVLTPPPGLSVPIPSDSPFCVSPEIMLRAKATTTNAKKKPGDRPEDTLNEFFDRAEGLVKKVYVQHPNYDHIATALLEAGLDGLAVRLPLTVGVPLLPTLGSPTRSLDEIYSRLELLPFSAEFKYDGQRAQIHASRDDNSQVYVKLFSRHLEDMTDKYPDVVALVTDMCKSRAGSFIIDAEIVAIDPNSGSLKSFQDLANRARKDVKLDDVKISVCVYAFDIMYLDEQILLERSFRERRALLRSRFPPVIPEQKGAARFDHVQSCESEEGREAIEEFWQTAVNSSCEGLMIKLLDNGEVLEDSEKGKSRRKPLPATYEPDKRTSAWLKLKKDYVTGLGDSLDLVPIGAWHGNGRKAQWWSPVLLAVWESETGKLVGVCKCMSGFSDVFYKNMKERYPENSETCSRQPLWSPAVETGGLRPEVYFKPQEVWEIRGADITMSPVSVAALGLVSQTRGLSLRFPRFIKIREDKGLEQASTPEFLANMYRNQQATGKDRTGADDGDLVDVDLEDAERMDSEASTS
ncbi:ATP-dependent DNA ligase [Sparassis latifolia]